mgnify:CR=1 FL=1
MTGGKIRLQKFLALCGVASRRSAEKLITDKIKQDINVMHTYRFYDGKELRRRTPLYVHGTPMHPVTKVVNYRQKHKKSHR